MQNNSQYPKPHPRTLPAGWWEGIPVHLRTGFDRKVLRQGYILNLDQALMGRNFFRQVHRGVIKEGGGEFNCLFRHQPKPSKADIRFSGVYACSCMATNGNEPCQHLAALLFHVYSGPAGTRITENYPNSFWAHLALCLCRSHAQVKVSITEEGAYRSLLENLEGHPLLELAMSDANHDSWYAEYLLKPGWEKIDPDQDPRSNAFAEWARQEILAPEKANIKTMGHIPSLRAEFGPIGDLCRQGFLASKKINATLNFSVSQRLFRLDFEDWETKLKGFAILDIEQAYSMHKRFPAIRLGEGFDEGLEIEGELVFEQWQKSLEIRVVSGSRLRIRPFATFENQNVFPEAEGQEIRFGDRILIANRGFRKINSNESALLKKYLGWKTYFVEATEVPSFIQKFGSEFTDNPAFDIDPLVLGKHQAVEMEQISILVHGKKDSQFQLGIVFLTGKTDTSSRYDLDWVKAQFDLGQTTHLTVDGWIDMTSFEWSWLKQLKPENWGLVDGKTCLYLDLPQIFRLCALQQPQTIQIHENSFIDSISAPIKSAALQELEYLTSLGKNVTTHAEPLPNIPSEGLRPYQQEGLQWLSNLVSYGLSGMLADDMGLGKTHQIMSLIAWSYSQSKHTHKTLVVCPTSVLYHWKSKLEKFHPILKTSVYHGPDRNLAELHRSVCITSYGILRNDLDHFKQAGFDLLILDEIQFLKNRDSESHRAFKDFPVRSIIGLSGTPLENSPMDVKNLFDLLLPGYFPGESEFKRTIMEPLESGFRVDQAKSNFLGLCRPFILRRTKSEVLTDLPEKVEETSFCDMAESQSALYKECLQKRGGPLLEELQGKSSGSLLHIFQLLNQLKQICNHPLSLPGLEENGNDYQSGKWELFTYLLERSLEAGHKIVVFSQYLAMLSHIENHLKKSAIGYATLIGATMNREAVLKKFETDPNCRVFCCSLKAGGVGIDLTAASTVIHYDRWWNAAKENQATDRVHRIGQNRNVQVYKLVTRNSIEEKIDAIIRKKSNWMDSLLPNDVEGGLKLFTREELTDLLNPNN